MSLEGKSKFYEHARGRVVLYVPADVHKDSQFPFKVGEPVIVKIEKDCLMIIKAK